MTRAALAARLDVNEHVFRPVARRGLPEAQETRVLLDPEPKAHRSLDLREINLDFVAEFALNDMSTIELVGLIFYKLNEVPAVRE
jgi:hypothetical protein